MKIEKGSTRRVFLFKNIVVKVARIYWFNTIKTIHDSFLYKTKLIKKGLSYYLNKTRERKESHLKNLCEYEKDRIRKEKEWQMKILHGKKYEIYCTVSYYLFSGIMANYHEYSFFCANKKSFCYAYLLFILWSN